MEYSFSVFCDFSKEKLSHALKCALNKNSLPIIVCIGSDLVLGDSLGPLVGTMLKRKNLGAYIYGTLNHPITAKEVEYAKKYLKLLHPNSTLIAIDAAVGKQDDVGLLRLFDRGLKPGLGVNKNLSAIGDISIIGVVAEKTAQNYKLFNLTRLNLVYKMAESISGAIETAIFSCHKNTEIV